MAQFMPDCIYEVGTEVTPVQSINLCTDTLCVAVTGVEKLKDLPFSDILPHQLIEKEKAVRLTRLWELDGCLYCTLNIPVKKDDAQHRAKLSLVVKENLVVLILHNDYAQTVLNRFTLSPFSKKETSGRFVYEFLEKIVDSDLVYLEDTEKRLGALEEQVLGGVFERFNHKIVPLKKELMQFHNFYAQLLDVADKLKDNGDGYLKEASYFSYLAEKTELLLNYTEMLRGYTIQITELYQTQIDAKQNRIMKLLTGVTTIFLPLTVITGWYGMNFKNMPELGWAFGYPMIIAVSLVILAACFWYFKKNDFF